MRFIFVPALLVVADPTDAQIATISVASFTAALVVHASVAEVWIRATRGSGALRGGESRMKIRRPHLRLAARMVRSRAPIQRRHVGNFRENPNRFPSHG